MSNVKKLAKWELNIKILHPLWVHRQEQPNIWVHQQSPLRLGRTGGDSRSRGAFPPKLARRSRPRPDPDPGTLPSAAAEDSPSLSSSSRRTHSLLPLKSGDPHPDTGMEWRSTRSLCSLGPFCCGSACCMVLRCSSWALADELTIFLLCEGWNRERRYTMADFSKVRRRFFFYFLLLFWTTHLLFAIIALPERCICRQCTCLLLLLLLRIIFVCTDGWAMWNSSWYLF